MAEAVTETLRCYECDRYFIRVVRRGRKPLYCPPCVEKPKRPKPRKVIKPAKPKTPGQRLALDVTRYRLAIQMAASAIRLGGYQEALDHLEDVAPKGQLR